MSALEKNRDVLQNLRRAYLPRLPQLLVDLAQVRWVQTSDKGREEEKIKSLFPLTSGQPVLQAERGEGKSTFKPLKVGVVFSGGQASGGHNVIVGVYDALKRLHRGARLFGFLGGPAGIVSGKSKELSLELLDSYRNQGGFDLIGSGRTKIETEEQFKASLAAVQALELDGLVIIGGDDSNTNAAFLAEFFKANGCQTRVIGVPKTIDGDLKNAYVGTSFGFDTACRVYSEVIGNIARDALSARKYYHFIKVMGRSASHIALECALATSPNLTLIGEEVGLKRLTLAQVVSGIADLVCRRAELGKHFGVLLIPEGLIEFIPEIGVLIRELNQILAAETSIEAHSVQDKLTPPSQTCFASLPEGIRRQLLLHRDPHGNVNVSLIETERLLIELVGKELALREKQGTYKGKFFPVSHFLGYEGRAGYPSNFDCNYCYALGFAATLLIEEGVTGYMACISHLQSPVEQWGVGGVPLTALMQLEVRKKGEKPVIKKALVDLHAAPFKYFERMRAEWECQDEYRYPGPIQFFGDAALVDRPPLTLLLESEHGMV